MDVAINCKIKMLAIAELEHAGVKYAPGETFYVGSAKTRQFHVDHKSARVVDADDSVETAPPTPEKSEQTTTKVNHGKPTKRVVRSR